MANACCIINRIFDDRMHLDKLKRHVAGKTQTTYLLASMTHIIFVINQLIPTDTQCTIATRNHQRLYRRYSKYLLLE